MKKHLRDQALEVVQVGYDRNSGRYTEERGLQKFHSVNKSHPIFPDLRNIVFKTFGVISQVKDALKPLEKKNKVAFIYGSFARGEEDAGSDIDLFVIDGTPLDEIVSALTKVKNAISREINPQSFFGNRIQEKVLTKEPFC